MDLDLKAAVRPPGAVRVSPTVLDLSGYSGLSSAIARQRLLDEGSNELPNQAQRSLARISLEVVREPMFLMLVAAATLYLFMGEISDAVMLIGSVSVVMLITIVQERRTERALDALRDLSSPRALVIRDGSQSRIPGRQVVRGDIIILAEGDRVPADGLLRRGINVSVDESLLTGESVPVHKIARDHASQLEEPGGDNLTSVFSGTLFTSGHGLLEVLATGTNSHLGQIGKALQQVETEMTPLQRETRRLVRILAVIGLAASLIVTIAYALTRGNNLQTWKEGLLAGITLVMATIPEEFPVVLTIFLALGAWRIAQSKVLTRRMPAIETLGAATILCVDKTGTLTLNQMSLRQLWTPDLDLDLQTFKDNLPDRVHSLLEFAILGSARDPFDPMERAILVAGDRFFRNSKHLHTKWLLERTYPLSPELLAMTHAWQSKDHENMVLASKGAPEAILELCALSDAERNNIEAGIISLASRGLRVLGVAQGQSQRAQLAARQQELKLEFVGLIGLEDPLRETVPAAVAECHQAGIRVVMITGDFPTTAQSIARQAGIANHHQLMTGAELNQLSDNELAERIEEISVFARVVPTQKLRIVNAFKSKQHVVAMTGDGVNDAPALKAAHIGIAMGGRGTDVAREAASLVLLEDDFSSIAATVRLGRRIYDNIKKAIFFLVTVHVPIVGLSIIPVFFKDWPLILLPVHVMLLELIIDPSCSLIFEAEEAEADVMRRPPRATNESLFSLKMLGFAVAQGLCVLSACVLILIFSQIEHDPKSVRALTFSSLVVSILVIILMNRSWSRSLIAMLKRPNVALRWVVLGTLSLLGLILFVPFMQKIFHFAPVHLPDLIFCLVFAIVCIIWFDVIKLKKMRHHSP